MIFHYETQKTISYCLFPYSFFFLCLSFQRTGIEDPDPLSSALLFLIGFKHSAMSSDFFPSLSSDS